MHRAHPLAQRLAALLPPLALVLLALLGCNRGLWTPDEPREAEISREMALAPGVIPTLNGERFIEKPPLYYWTVAGIFRLTGGASVAGARAVSVAAGLATLALLAAWGSSAHSRAAGSLAALMLASSAQFLVSSHWVLIDPLLMLTTTLAAWAAWTLLARGDSRWLLAVLYGSLGLALWIKGLIGPVLVTAGLSAYVIIDRPSHWRRLRPVAGAALLALAVLLLGAAIWKQGGNAALWEWAWVNHVQRLLSPPGAIGHRQPLLYYTWTLPYAILPWLPPLAEALRPSHWRHVTVAGLPRLSDPARYGALVSGAMLLLLSVSATKRETYLLPVLPLLFLWLGIRTCEWWQQWQLRREAWLGLLWWLQVALLILVTLAAPVAGWIWLRAPNAWILGALLVAVPCAASLLYFSMRGDRLRAGPAALVCAVVGGAVVLALAPPLLNATKDMGPFVRWIGEQLPAGEPVYATGVDETLRAEVPFYTGRAVVPVDLTQLRSPVAGRPRPPWVLMQDNSDGRDGSLEPAYTLIAERVFGAHRRLLLWHLRPSGSAS